MRGVPARSAQGVLPETAGPNLLKRERLELGACDFGVVGSRNGRMFGSIHSRCSWLSDIITFGSLHYRGKFGWVRALNSAPFRHTYMFIYQIKQTPCCFLDTVRCVILMILQHDIDIWHAG